MQEIWIAARYQTESKTQYVQQIMVDVKEICHLWGGRWIYFKLNFYRAWINWKQLSRHLFDLLLIYHICQTFNTENALKSSFSVKFFLFPTFYSYANTLHPFTKAFTVGWLDQSHVWVAWKNYEDTALPYSICILDIVSEEKTVFFEKTSWDGSATNRNSLMLQTRHDLLKQMDLDEGL